MSLKTLGRKIKEQKVSFFAPFWDPFKLAAILPLLRGVQRLAGRWGLLVRSHATSDEPRMEGVRTVQTVTNLVTVPQSSTRTGL